MRAQNHSRFPALFPIFTICATCLATVAESFSRSTIPPDGKLQITDYGYRDWGPELVHYTIDPTRFVAGKVALTNAKGERVPCQINGNNLCFVTSVSKGETATYELKSTKTDRSTTHSTLTSALKEGNLEIRNEWFALRMPAPGTKQYASPVDAATVPAPLLHWANHSQDWIGKARFRTQRKVSSHTFSIIREGPAVIEYEARYLFVPQGGIRLAPTSFPGNARRHHHRRVRF